MNIKKPPEHLSTKAKKFWKQINDEYELEIHHQKILTLACECLDRSEEARKAIDKTALIYLDRFKKPKINPAAKVELDNKNLASKLIRELGLDIEAPREPGRPPSLY